MFCIEQRFVYLNSIFEVSSLYEFLFYNNRQIIAIFALHLDKYRLQSPCRDEQSKMVKNPENQKNEKKIKKLLEVLAFELEIVHYTQARFECFTKNLQV